MEGPFNDGIDCLLDLRKELSDKQQATSALKRTQL